MSYHRISHCICLIFISLSICSQHDLDNIKSLTTVLKDGQIIPLDEWKNKDLLYPGIFTTRLSAWNRGTTRIEGNSKGGIEFLIDKSHSKKHIKEYSYRRLVIKNYAAYTIQIPRIDATLGGLQEYFFLDGKWVKGRVNGTSTCGNSYFNQGLKPNHQVEFDLDSGRLYVGQSKIKYKVAIVIEKRTYESNEILVYLNEATIEKIINQDY